MDKVIRVNVHLGEEQIKFLDALVNEINEDRYCDLISRADIVRWSIATAAGAPMCNPQYWDKRVGEKVKAILKKREDEKSKTQK